MKPKDEDNLAYVIKQTILRMNARYRKGNAEHEKPGSEGGGIFKLNLLDEAIEEQIDSLVYLLTLKRKNEDIDDRL